MVIDNEFQMVGASSIGETPLVEPFMIYNLRSKGLVPKTTIDDKRKMFLRIKLPPKDLSQNSNPKSSIGQASKNNSGNIISNSNTPKVANKSSPPTCTTQSSK